MSQQRVSQLLKEEVMVTDSDGALLILESLKNFYKLRAGAASAGDELDYMQEKAQHERIKREISEIQLAKLQGSVYDARIVELVMTDGVLLLTASVDVQGNRLEYEICGWGMAEESWGIRKGIILGKPNQPKTWEMLDDVIDRTYSFTDGTGLKVTRTFIDSGGLNTAQVYDYCRRNAAKQRFAIKGQGGTGIPLLHKIGRAKVSGIALVMLGVDDGKQQVMNRLASSRTRCFGRHGPMPTGTALS